MQQPNWLGIAAVVALYAVFLVVGLLASRRLKHGTASELILAGRAMPFWMATLTMAATWIDGGYLLGTAEGVFTNLPTGWQGGVCFGLSLVLGGFFFARTMRRLRFVTLVDPLAARFGPRWGAVLSLPALLGEVLWAAELLVALGASTGVVLGIDLPTAILLSAAVVTTYSVVGGLWSIGYTDLVQFGLIPLGMLLALPFALESAGGLETCWSYYQQAQGPAAALVPPLEPNSYWTAPRIVSWWDMSIMLVLGGIPWNCYFQRVQACQTPDKARWHSITAGVITIVLTFPPLLLGLAAFGFHGWTPQEADTLRSAPTMALPLLLVSATPRWVAVAGLAAIVGAVTSSFSASILSAGSMVGWNLLRGLIAPNISSRALLLGIRASVVALAALACAMALQVESVRELWFLTSDLVFVILFPQLLYALFDPRVNRTGSIAAFAVSLVMRLGGGESLLGVPAFIPYATIFAGVLPGDGAGWLDPAGHATLFPVRTCAAVAGLVLLPVVSRLTARWDPPRPIPTPEGDEA